MIARSFIYTVAPYGVNITGNNTYPHGSQLKLHCSSEGGPQLEYSWSRTNTLSNDTTTNTNNLTISNVTTLDGGNYTCTVTNDAGSSSNNVTVYGQLVILHTYFYVSTVLLCVFVYACACVHMCVCMCVWQHSQVARASTW